MQKHLFIADATN